MSAPPALPLPLAGVTALTETVDHAEGVALAPDGALWAGGEAGQLYRIADGTTELVAETGAGGLLGIALDAAGRVYACAGGRRAVVRYDPATGALDNYCEAAGGARLRIPNFCAFLADGTLLLSDSGSPELDERAGAIVRIPPGGGEGELLETPPLHFPNGLAVAPDGRLAVLESFTPRLALLDLATGDYDVVADLPGTVPDGVAYDAEGGALVSCYQPNRVLRVTPAGGVATVFDDWMGALLLSPTNVAFHGPGLRHLAMASLLGTCVYSAELPWAGRPLPLPVV
jgi:gluconolactonase